MIGEDYEATLRSLTRLERIVLRNIPRLVKSNGNVFHAEQLGKKWECRDIEVEPILGSLARKRLVHPVKLPILWETTPLGRRIGHDLFDQKFEEEFGFSIRRV